MNELAKKYPTYEDILALPEGVRAEVINGQLETSAAKPNFGHRRVTLAMSSEIGSRFRKEDDSGWIIEIEPDVQFGPHILSPDLAGWKKERRGNPNPLESLVTIIPDWACEILSPSSGRRDRVEKFKIYQEHGVTYYWIIDPINQTLEAFVNDTTSKNWKRLGAWGGNEKARIEPFNDLEIDLSSFWVASVQSN
jgi:Uma2 family endonuclease